MNTQPLAVRADELAAPSIPNILAAAVQGGVTKENVDVVRELIAMQREVRAEEARSDFARAFAALQSECGQVKASKSVPDKQGNTKYFYAPYEGIMEKVSPLLSKNQFAVTFDTKITDDNKRVLVKCTLMHASGHERSNEFACRIGSGPPNASEAQSDGAATTYAKRFALCAALNIVVDTDTDARAEGDFITGDQADILQSLCAETGSDESKLLKFAGAESFGTIRESRYNDVLEVLKKKQAQKASSKPSDKDHTW